MPALELEPTQRQDQSRPAPCVFRRKVCATRELRIRSHREEQHRKNSTTYHVHRHDSTHNTHTCVQKKRKTNKACASTSIGMRNICCQYQYDVIILTIVPPPPKNPGKQHNISHRNNSNKTNRKKAWGSSLVDQGKPYWCAKKEKHGGIQSLS